MNLRNLLPTKINLAQFRVISPKVGNLVQQTWSALRSQVVTFSSRTATARSRYTTTVKTSFIPSNRQSKSKHQNQYLSINPLSCILAICSTGRLAFRAARIESKWTNCWAERRTGRLNDPDYCRTSSTRTWSSTGPSWVATRRRVASLTTFRRISRTLSQRS